MSDPRLDHAREQYTQHLDTLNALKTSIELSAKLCLAQRSIDAVVTGRVKTLDSLIKKLIRKPEHTYESLSDQVGIRIISNDANRACAAMREYFTVVKEEDKSAERDHDRLGYPGIHLDVQLRDDDPARAKFLTQRAEIQIRTYAQHAWCDVSHRFDYKQDKHDIIPPKLKRRLMLTVGLLEIADLDLNDIATQITALEAFQVDRTIDVLERYYFRLTARPTDRELSRLTITALAPLYGGGLDELESRIQVLFEKKLDTLRQVFERNERSTEPRASLFFQPETLVVYDLLDTEAEALRDAWVSIIPEDELYRLASEFGHTYENET